MQKETKPQQNRTTHYDDKGIPQTSAKPPMPKVQPPKNNSGSSTSNNDKANSK